MFDFGGSPIGALFFFVHLSDRRVPTLNGPFTQIVSHLFEPEKLKWQLVVASWQAQKKYNGWAVGKEVKKLKHITTKTY